MMCTYLFTDFLFNIFVLKIKTTIDKQMVLHHVVAFTAIFAALIGGYGSLNVGIFLTLTECSSIPLNRRNMMTKRENKEKLGTCNNLAFLVNYTVFRIINLPYCVFKLV